MTAELHIPPHVAQELPAVKLDWLLAIHGVVQTVRSKAASDG